MFPIDFLYRGALRNPDAPALSDGQSRFTHRELSDRVNALAAGFQAVAGKDRPKIGLCGYNTLQMVFSWLAIHACGGIMIPFNPRYSAADVRKQIAFTEPDLIVCDADCGHLLEGADGFRSVVGAGGAGEGLSVDALIGGHRGEMPVWPAVRRDDMNAIKFTGGSSGVPKGVMQTFRVGNAVSNGILWTYGITSADRFLCGAPLTHAAGAFILPTLYVGGSVILAKKASSEEMLALLESGDATLTWVPPTLAYSIMEAAGARRPQFRGLNAVIYGGAAMPRQKLLEFRDFFRGRVGVDFGQTEASTIVTGMGPEEMADDARLTSVGRAVLLSSVAIVDGDGRRLPPGEPGEIIVGGDLLMSGYYEMPEQTSETIRDGWLHTGDVGYLDESGYLYIRGRIRDVIISGGFNVYPSDVEAGLSEHPAVYECVVFGVPDDKWGERVEAAVELREGASIGHEELVRFCKERLGSVKAPKAVHVVKSLPRSAVGKVQRREARALFLGDGLV